MISALLFLQYQSIKNRTVLRLKRLKQPKYLVGGIVGAIYFYFYFFRYLFGLPGRRPGFNLGAGPETAMAYEGIGASIFLIAVLLAWVLPHERAALSFTEAEVAFLFPAPITRRGLIHFKLLRSQAAILFTTLVLMLVTNRFGGKFWIHAAGWWVILSTLNLHLLGSSFARTGLMDRGVSNWRRRFIVLVILALAVLGMVFWSKRTFPEFDFAQIQDFTSLQDYLQKLLTSGPLPWLLFPFRLVIRPYLAPDGRAFLLALGPAMLLLLLHYWWVVRSDVAFEEASVEASRRLAEKVAAIRSGNFQSVRVRTKGGRAPFALGSVGSPAIALLWKNLISAGRAFTPRLWIILATSALMVCAFLARSTEDSSLLAAIGMAAGMLVAWSLFIGPQILRQDLRQDLPLTDLLKMYPIRGWEVALGELLAPASILTGVQWLLLLIAAVLLWSAPNSHLSRPVSLGIAIGSALVMPLLNLIILQIPNASVVLFPAWFQTGKDRAAGIEVTGQRIIAIFAQVLVFVITMIPASIAFAMTFFLFNKFLGYTMLGIVSASVVAAIILSAEAILGIVLLGRLFDRFDVSAELPPAS